MRCVKAWLGNEKAEWCICPAKLSKESVIYSFGIGTDVSFDLELIRRFGATVHGFDPTPRSISWVRAQRLPEQFVIHEFGIYAHDGNAVFRPPENTQHVSYSVLPRGGATAGVVEAPVRRLATIMKMLGHARVDLLKMDIEGGEYEVVEDLIGTKIAVGQLLVEFHHRWPEAGLPRTREAVQKLNQAGFRVFNVSATGEEYSFIKL